MRWKAKQSPNLGESRRLNLVAEKEGIPRGGFSISVKNPEVKKDFEVLSRLKDSQFLNGLVGLSTLADRSLSLQFVRRKSLREFPQSVKAG